MTDPGNIGPVISIESYENLRVKLNAQRLEKERAIVEEEKVRKQAEDEAKAAEQGKVCFYLFV